MVNISDNRKEDCIMALIEDFGIECHKAIEMITAEYEGASRAFMPMMSPHDGLDIVIEEAEEFQRAVRHGTPEEAVKECVQLAAMALRFLVDVGGMPTNFYKRSKHE